MTDFNGQDEAILEILAKDCKITTREIAKKTGIPHSTVHKKIKQMESEGIITGYRATIDYKKIGKGTRALVLAGTTPRADYTAMMKEILKHKEVEEIAAVSGDFDIAIMVRTTDVDQLDKFVFENLRRVEGMTNTHTMIIFRYWKA